MLWAHRVGTRFPDGQLCVDLRGFDPTGRPVPSIVAARASVQPASPLIAFADELTDALGRLDALDAGDRNTRLRTVPLRADAAWLVSRLDDQTAAEWDVLVRAVGWAVDAGPRAVPVRL